MTAPTLQLLAAALLGFGLAQLQFLWEPLWGRSTDHEWQCLRSSQNLFNPVNTSTHHINGSSQPTLTSTADPPNEPGSRRCGLPAGLISPQANTSSVRESARAVAEEMGAWVRLSDKELADALTVSELASLTGETPTPGKCMLGGSNLEGRWVLSAIWPQQGPTLAFAESLRMRWSGWRGTTMLDIARTLASRKVRLLIAGDSMAGQVFRAAECGLIRLGATQLPTSSAFMTSLTGGVDTITLEPSVFTLPPDNIEFQMVFLNVQNANKQVLARINQTSSTIWTLLLANFGAILYNEGLHAHRGGEKRYESKMHDVLDQLQTAAEAAATSAGRGIPPVVMFKETSAQHFFSFSGDGQWESFQLESASSCWMHGTNTVTPLLFNGSCNPRLLFRTCAPTPRASNWRNEIVEKIISNERYSRIHLLRWFKYTLPRWDLHEDQRNVSAIGSPIRVCRAPGDCTLLPDKGGQDCTHFVYTPFLYEPLWDEVANALSAVYQDKR